MALDFLGGIAGAYQAIQKGVDDSKQRDYVDKRRQWQEEDRAAQLEDREYNRGQRQRTLEEQRRADRLRDADAAIQFEVDAAPAPGGASPGLKPGGITKPATPAAPPATAMPMVEGAPTEPVAPMPVAEAQPGEPVSTTPVVGEQPAPQPKTLPKRQITYGEYLRQLAKNRQDVGQTGQAMELRQKADQWNLEQAGRRLSSVIASAPGMQPDQLAATVTEMFNSDPLPTQVRNLKHNGDGTFSGTVYGTDSGKEMPVNFKNAADMLQGLQAYYQPETFAKLQQAAAEARIKAQEKLNENPFINVPAGGMAIDRRTGKTVVNNTTGMVPTAWDENGEPTAWSRSGAGGAGAGSGRGGKVEDPMKAVNDAFELVATKGESKLMPNQIAQGRRIAQDLARNGLDAGLAVEVALEVATDPSKAQPKLNLNTGEFDLVYKNQRVNRGQPIRISSGAATLGEIEKAEGGKDAIKTQVEDLVNHMVSAVPEDGRTAARQQLVSIASNPEMRKAYLEAAANAGKDVAAITRQLDLVRQYAPAQQKSEGSGPAQTIISRLRGATGGLTPKSDPNSPAGRFQARQEQARAAASEQSAASEKASSSLSEQFNRDKSTMDPLEFARKYDAQRLKLNAADAAELRRIEKGL